MPEICKYRPLRMSSCACQNEADTPWGFCNKHKRTVQSTEAKKEWDKRNNSTQTKGNTTRKTSKVKVKVTMNKFGKYEDRDTHLIFNPITKNVIGYQNPDGSVRALNSQDIQKCKERGWKYATIKVPEEDESSSEEESEYETEDESSDVETDIDEDESEYETDNDEESDDEDDDESEYETDDETEYSSDDYSSECDSEE